MSSAPGSVNALGPSRPGYYTTLELEYFEHLVTTIFAELREDRSPLAAPERAAATKARIGAAIFRAAADGEREYYTLKRSARAAVSDIDPPSRPFHRG